MPLVLTSGRTLTSRLREHRGWMSTCYITWHPGLRETGDLGEGGVSSGEQREEAQLPWTFNLGTMRED